VFVELAGQGKREAERADSPVERGGGGKARQVVSVD